MISNVLWYDSILLQHYDRDVCANKYVNYLNPVLHFRPSTVVDSFAFQHAKICYVKFKWYSKQYMITTMK